MGPKPHGVGIAETRGGSTRRRVARVDGAQSLRALDLRLAAVDMQLSSIGGLLDSLQASDGAGTDAQAPYIRRAQIEIERMRDGLDLTRRTLTEGAR